MNNRENARYDMFGRVSTFAKNNAADFAAGSKATAHFASITQVSKDLDAAKAGQQGGGTTAKEVLLDALRLDVQNIGRTARAITQDEPGFSDNFPSPANSAQPALLTTADAYLLELKKAGVAARFIANELPTDFVKDLADDRAAIEAAKDAVESDDIGGVASTAAVGRLIKAGMKEVNYVDAIMHNKYSRDGDKLRAWKSASHIERAPQREKAPALTATRPSPAGSKR
jgi:hypothetical protein